MLKSSLRKFYGRLRVRLTVTEYMCHQWARICPVFRNRHPVLSSYKTGFVTRVTRRTVLVDHPNSHSVLLCSCRPITCRQVFSSVLWWQLRFPRKTMFGSSLLYCMACILNLCYFHTFTYIGIQHHSRITRCLCCLIVTQKIPLVKQTAYSSWAPVFLWGSFCSIFNFLCIIL